MIFSLTPNQAILLLTTGIFLIDIELNRPGWIVPGMIGLIATLLAVAALIHSGVNPDAALLCGSGTVVLAISLRRTPNVAVYAVATAAVTLGLLKLNPRVHAIVAVPCGVFLGAGTSVLTRIARRARINKGLD